MKKFGEFIVNKFDVGITIKNLIYSKFNTFFQWNQCLQTNPQHHSRPYTFHGIVLRFCISFTNVIVSTVQYCYFFPFD